MTERELKQAFNNKCPIMAFTRAISLSGDWVEYAYINSIIYTRDRFGNDILCAELMDKSGNSVAKFRAESIKAKGA